ncbi:MAG: hypothetical protein PUF12_12085 [Thermoflexaceae bacterium]|nr:hypothetical protein [Thermoflexaceae bacterium]
MEIFTPYRVCPLGAHVDHQHGVITGFAIDRGVHLDYEATGDGSISLTSRNFEGTEHFYIDDIPEREMTWGDFIKGAVIALKRKYNLQYGIQGEIEGTLPIGGLSSSAAVILTYLNALCRVNNISMTRVELINTAIWEERNYIGVNVGKLDQSCEVYCRKNSLLVLDTLDDSSEIIPVNRNMPDFEIMIIFSGLERKLAGSAYNTRVDECKSAAYALMAFSGMEYGRYKDACLRDVPYGIYQEHKKQLPANWAKRAEHFYSEHQRVREGIRAWRKGDLERFGRLVFESGRSSVENYETGSRELAALQDIMEHTEGIYGGRFSGAGFNGSSMALINPAKKDEIKEHVTREYLKKFPDLKDRFSVYFCRTTDGVAL